MVCAKPSNFLFRDFHFFLNSEFRIKWNERIFIVVNEIDPGHIYSSFILIFMTFVQIHIIWIRFGLFFVYFYIFSIIRFFKQKSCSKFARRTQSIVEVQFRFYVVNVSPTCEMIQNPHYEHIHIYKTRHRRKVLVLSIACSLETSAMWSEWNSIIFHILRS